MPALTARQWKDYVTDDVDEHVDVVMQTQHLRQTFSSTSMEQVRSHLNIFNVLKNAQT